MDLTRREFLATSAIVTSGSLLRPTAFPKSFQTDERHLIPIDKKLDPRWVASLTQRGAPEIFEGRELRFIGMPVGGCFAGTVYLSGDGRLWNWDVFNQYHLGCIPNPGVKYRGEALSEGSGANYVSPREPWSPFSIQFAIDDVPLELEHWQSVRFRGEYPIGTVHYRSKQGLEVQLEAFSPFIPLDIERSSYPLTIVKITVKNTSSESKAHRISCSFEHPSLLYSKKDLGLLKMAPSKAGRWNGALASIEGSAGEDISSLHDYGSFAVASEGAAVEILNRERPAARVERTFEISSGQSESTTFLVAWHYPNAAIQGFEGQKRWYAAQWKSAWEVVVDVAKNLKALDSLTRAWRDTWYDSTLPYWLLDRSFVNTCILATNTCHRFADGRYWFWEGVGCCAGTCTHVWSYAQAIGHVFPEVERTLREKIDFGRFFDEKTGVISYRGEFGPTIAHDGQCGCILRAYREHLMSADPGYLKRLYPRIKIAMEALITGDTDQDGLLETGQYNTLDAAWYGKIAWISSLFIAALRACEKMAVEMGDRVFEERCRTLAETGTRSMETKLFDGEYFINIPEPAHRDRNNTNIGCHIDQLYGQFWTHQLGLPPVVSSEKAKSAMASLFKYSFAPDVGVYRSGMKTIKGGRWYAMPGEAGLIMCTFPKGGADQAVGLGQDAWAGMYFNECMSGFEYQAAACMISEGLIKEGLAVARAIHERYHPSKRNPYNEVECSDHYGRSMASFGVFTALTGFHARGPREPSTFAPLTGAENFRAAFIESDGWGTYRQSIGRDGKVRIQKRYRYRTKAPATT